MPFSFTGLLISDSTLAPGSTFRIEGRPRFVLKPAAFALSKRLVYAHFVLKMLDVPDTTVLLTRQMAILQTHKHVQAVQNGEMVHVLLTSGTIEGLYKAICICGWSFSPVDTLST